MSSLPRRSSRWSALSYGVCSTDYFSDWQSIGRFSYYLMPDLSEPLTPRSWEGVVEPFVEIHIPLPVRMPYSSTLAVLTPFLIGYV